MVNLANNGSGSTVYLVGPGTNLTEFVALLGAVPVPDAVDGAPLGRGASTGVSTELLPTALSAAEFVLALRYGGSADSDRAFAERTADPVWRAVPAVAAGEVAYLDVQRAGGKVGVAGVRLALDDLAAQRARGGA